ncbi:MAG TPA: hypothetical protein VHA37_01935 [Candidatus Saccharimonadales bacterium]|nr:hypothetical protein [Candidatus Saccharimonadales bacterium]
MKLDDEWIRINEDFDAAGNRQAPESARMVRSDGGMIIGRIARISGKFVAQTYKKGTFNDIDQPFGSFDEAAFAMRQLMFSRR